MRREVVGLDMYAWHAVITMKLFTCLAEARAQAAYIPCWAAPNGRNGGLLLRVCLPIHLSLLGLADDLTNHRDG